MLSRIEGFIRHFGLIDPGGRVLVGVSGGVDSVVLLHVLKALGYQVAVAHLNYGLRGEASEQDAEFVLSLAKELAVSCSVKKVDTLSYAKTHGLNKQVAARQLRYDFFAEQAKVFGCPVVALGHHADDQLETVLWNLVKGTGPAGLRGMLPQRGPFIRPLLAVSRKEIEAYAHACHYTWREDATNQQPVYTRNKLRLQVVPLLRELNPQVAENLEGTTARVRFAESLLQQFLAKVRQQMQEGPPGVWLLPLAEFQLFPEPATGLYFLLQDKGITLEQAQQIWEYKHNTAPRHFSLLHGFQVWVQAGKAWLLSPETGQPAGEKTLPDTPFAVALGTLDVYGETVPCNDAFRLLKDPWFFQGDADLLRFPLHLRPWQPGDAMQPLGMKGHKKISDLLNEAQWPVVHRARLMVLLSEGEIVWAAGLRIADWVKVGPDTKNVLQIQLTERI